MEESDNESEISFKSDHKNFQKTSLTQKIMNIFIPNNINLQKTILSKYFSCCFPQEEEKAEISDLDNNDAIEETYMANEEIDGVMSVFPSKYIRKDERKYIKFDKENIISFYEDLKKKEFDRKFDKFKKFGLSMFMLDKNDFSSTIPVTRCQIEIPNTLFSNGPPTVEQIGDAIINADSRIQWDDNFKEYKILGKLNGNTEIIKIVTKKQMQMLIPREFFEKRTHFIDNGIFYSYSSSAPDNIRPPKKEPIRCMDYFGIFTVSTNNQNIFIDGFHQVDIKIGQPGPLIIMSLPLKLTEFTENLIKFFNH